MGLAAAVLVLFSRSGAAAHADVLDGSAKAGAFMALKVGQADEYVRIHDGPSDTGFLYVLATLNRNRHVIRSL